MKRKKVSSKVTKNEFNEGESTSVKEGFRFPSREFLLKFFDDGIPT